MKRLVALFALASLAACSVSVASAQERAIRKETVVDAPVAAAWAAWTTSEGVQSFFAPDAVIFPRTDGPFSVHFNPYAMPGMRGADDMRVLAVQENRMISFTWNAPPHLPEARAQKTVVIVRTEPEGENRTRVRLTHTGWGDGGQWDQAYQYFDQAWGRVLAAMQKRFSEKPNDWTEWLARMKAFEEGERKKAPPAKDRVLRLEKVVAAPPAEVWKAFSTVEGLQRWAAPVVAIDLRNGGWMRTHYDRAKKIGSPGTIHLDILSVVEGELVTYKVNLNEHFPAKVRAEDRYLQEVVRLVPTADGKTRIISAMTGWGSGKEWDEAYGFFAKGNEWSYGKLVESFGGK